MTAADWLQEYMNKHLTQKVYVLDGICYNREDSLREICSRMAKGVKAEEIQIAYDLETTEASMTEILAGRDGGSTPSQYAFSGCSSMQELVKYRGMKRNIAAIFKACIPVAQYVPERLKLLDVMIEMAQSELREPSDEEPDFVFGTEAIPIHCHEIQDLIEYHNMNFSVGNIFKACYRIGHCDHSSKERDLNKCIWFATREFRRHGK